MYHMELDPEAPVMDFRKEIEKHTYIAPSKSIFKFQKFIFEVKYWFFSLFSKYAILFFFFRLSSIQAQGKTYPCWLWKLGRLQGQPCWGMHVYDYAINHLPDLRVEPSETDPSKTANKFRFRKFLPQNLHKNERRKNVKRLFHWQHIIFLARDQTRDRYGTGHPVPNTFLPGTWIPKLPVQKVCFPRISVPRHKIPGQDP